MRTTAFIAALILMSTAAQADSFSVPLSDPIATLKIPANWKPKPYEGGIEATSPDGKVYIAAEGVDAADVGQATEDGIKFLEEQGLVLDRKTMKGKNSTLNGLKDYEITVDGKDKIGPASVDLIMVLANKPGKVLMIYLWGDMAGAKANATAIVEMQKSIALTK